MDFYDPQNAPTLFMFRRELLGDLVRLAYETINELLSEAAGDHKARSGVVAVPQTFGSVLNVHPPLRPRWAPTRLRIHLHGFSVEDWLCFIVCRNRSWSCLSNDRALLSECGRAGIRVRRSLGLPVELVQREELSEKRALRVAQRIHQSNPHHINERVLAAFRRALGLD